MKPILFNTEMVKAILEGRKTSTRRIIKQKYKNADIEWFTNKYGTRLVEMQNDTPPDEYNPETHSTKVYLKEFAEIKPPYQVGDTLYIRETWCKSKNKYYFKADNKCTGCTEDGRCLPKGVEKHITCELCEDKDGYIKWRPSIHMPKKIARIFLKVTDVKVQKIQDITEKDILKEGIARYTIADNAPKAYGDNLNADPKEAFKTLWNSTVNKKDIDKYGWDANCWVWVIEFERIEKSKEMNG